MSPCGCLGPTLSALSGGRQAHGFSEDTDTQCQLLVSTFLVPSELLVWKDLSLQED